MLTYRLCTFAVYQRHKNLWYFDYNFQNEFYLRICKNILRNLFIARQLFTDFSIMATMILLAFITVTEQIWLHWYIMVTVLWYHTVNHDIVKNLSFNGKSIFREWGFSNTNFALLQRILAIPLCITLFL